MGQLGFFDADKSITAPPPLLSRARLGDRFAAHPRGAPGDRRHDHVEDFQMTLLGALSIARSSSPARDRWCGQHTCRVRFLASWLADVYVASLQPNGVQGAPRCH